MSAVRLVEGYCPGVIAEVIGLHMDYYAPAWGFGAPFEAKLARELGAFHARYDPRRDLFVTARGGDGALLGTITVDGGEDDPGGAHLRWFIVAPGMAGQGIGGALMRRADAFLRAIPYPRAYLTTFRGLDAARRLYERYGFRLAGEEAQDPWAGHVGLQRFERDDGHVPAGS
ncbi:GNAT family N-acetyltransferase [Arhodomonas aquaeolei]|uniref:GNAT family N-acetyltransferase n=1 Tax=Arhodomonas aquaeolei TaxID=2369 RepID=UPI00036E7763|nr:GNAT family N-acetyltransferase [Arhodomonas aquaeolei]